MENIDKMKKKKSIEKPHKIKNKNWKLLHTQIKCALNVEKLDILRKTIR